MDVFQECVIITIFLSFGQISQTCPEICRCFLTKGQLVVKCSDLHHVPESLPRNTTKLYLTGNKFSTIPKEYFENFRQLELLNISDNQYLGLENASVSFYGLRNTAIKVIVTNNVVPVDVGCVILKKTFFMYLKDTNLEEIQLDRNRILTIEQDAFSFVPDTLQRLSLQHSRLILPDSVRKQFLELKNVTVLDISNLNGELYPPFGMEIEKVSALERNHLHKHPISPFERTGVGPTPISVVINVPPHLKTFIAKDCYFRMPALETSVNVSFSSNSLIYIDFSRNRIRGIWANITGVESLEELKLENNVLEYISPILPLTMPNLKHLSLSGNKLRFTSTNITKVPFVKLETLDLSSNSIHEIHILALEGYSSISKLNFSGNVMHYFNVKIDHMISLSSLDLSYNQIDFLTLYMMKQLDTFSSRRQNLSLYLEGNPFTCSCERLAYLRWIKTTSIALDRGKLYCFFYKGQMAEIPIGDAAEELENSCTSFHVGIAMGGAVGVTGSMVIIIIGLVYRFRWKLRYLYYIVRDKYRGSLSSWNENDTDFEYDAFVSYAEEDSHFAVETFIDKLERDYNLRLCLHQRDFRPGQSIASNILSAIQKSRHVVIVLSPNFLDSYWCRWEFEMARMEGLYTERNVVVLVRYQEVLPSAAPRDMLYMMHTHTYLQYPHGQQDQSAFWTTLFEAVRGEQ